MGYFPHYSAIPSMLYGSIQTFGIWRCIGPSTFWSKCPVHRKILPSPNWVCFFGGLLVNVSCCVYLCFSYGNWYSSHLLLLCPRACAGSCRSSLAVAVMAWASTYVVADITVGGLTCCTAKLSLQEIFKIVSLCEMDCGVEKDKELILKETYYILQLIRNKKSMILILLYVYWKSSW